MRSVVEDQGITAKINIANISYKNRFLNFSKHPLYRLYRAQIRKALEIFVNSGTHVRRNVDIFRVTNCRQECCKQMETNKEGLLERSNRISVDHDGGTAWRYFSRGMLAISHR